MTKSIEVVKNGSEVVNREVHSFDRRLFRLKMLRPYRHEMRKHVSVVILPLILTPCIPPVAADTLQAADFGEVVQLTVDELLTFQR